MIARNQSPALYCGMRFEKIWAEQCRATKAIKRRFGAKSALDYLIGEKSYNGRLYDTSFSLRLSLTKTTISPSAIARAYCFFREA